MTLDRGHHIYVLALNRLTLRSRSERRGLVDRSGSEVSPPHPPQSPDAARVPSLSGSALFSLEWGTLCT